MGKGTEIVTTIIQQLGGQRFRAMTGADNYTSRDGGTTFGFRFKICRKANGCLIHINGRDLYDITFYQYSRKYHTATTKQEYNDVYAEDLQRTFTEYTGLDTHL